MLLVVFVHYGSFILGCLMASSSSGDEMMESKGDDGMHSGISKKQRMGGEGWSIPSLTP